MGECTKNGIRMMTRPNAIMKLMHVRVILCLQIYKAHASQAHASKFPGQVTDMYLVYQRLNRLPGKIQQKLCI